MNHLIKYGFLPEKQTVFLLCDMQERFRPIISHFEEIAHNCSRLVSKFPACFDAVDRNLRAVSFFFR